MQYLYFNSLFELPMVYVFHDSLIYKDKISNRYEINFERSFFTNHF